MDIEAVLTKVTRGELVVDSTEALLEGDRSENRM